MLKEENIIEALSKDLKGEKLVAHLYASDLKANSVWIWVMLFIFIMLVVLFVKNDIAIILCALVGGIIGGYSGYNQPTYLGVTSAGNLLICKVKLDNKTPRFTLKLPIKSLSDVQIKTADKNGKNILHFKYNNKEFEYIYFRKVANKNLNSQSENVDKFNKVIKK